MLYHHFQMQLLQTRVDIFRGGQVVISAPDGWEWGGGDITGRDKGLYHYFQMQLLQTRVDIFKRAGSNFFSCWLVTRRWRQYRPGQCVISSFPNAASTNKSGHIQGGR